MAVHVRNRELFYAGLMGLTLLLPAPGFLVLAVTGPASSSVLARLLAPTTVGAMYFSFVLLPALIGFLAIAVPAGVRGLMARRPSQPDIVRAAAVLASVAVYLTCAGAGYLALAALLLIAAAAAAPAAPLLARMAPWLAPRAALAACACWAGVVWYQIDAVRGAEPSYAIAPTLAVLAMALAVLAATTAIARAAGCGGAWWRAAACGLGAIVMALLAPRLSLLLTSSAAATIEVGLGASAVLLGATAAVLGRSRDAQAAGAHRSANAASSATGPSHRVGGQLENP